MHAINLLTPQMGEGQCLYKLRLRPQRRHWHSALSNPTALPLGLDLLDFWMPWTPQADLHTRLCVFASPVVPLPIVLATSSNVRSCLLIPSWLFTLETQLLDISTNETWPNIWMYIRMQMYIYLDESKYMRYNR